MSYSSVDDWTEKETRAADSQALSAYQLEKVRETLGYVLEHSAFYRERLGSFAGGISSVTDLPCTLPEDLENHSSRALCVPQGKVQRIVTHVTSGTTSQPKRAFFTENDLLRTVEFFHHGMMEFTESCDRALILFPGGKEGSIGNLLAQGLVRFGAEPLQYGIVADFEDLLRFVAGQSIQVIAGLPQQLLELARVSRQRGGIPGLRGVLISADYAADSLVRALEKELRCPVYEHYGLTEICFGGGVYAKDRDGYHLRHRDFLFEILAPGSNLPPPPGEYGEVTVTSLNAEAMPLIRYRTGDVARFAPGPRRFPALEKIKGRLKGGARLANGETLSMSELEEALFEHEDVLDFRASYGEKVLELAVRFLPGREDPAVLLETIRLSLAGAKLRGCEVRVSAVSDRNISKNTMTKRLIAVM